MKSVAACTLGTAGLTDARKTLDITLTAIFVLIDKVTFRAEYALLSVRDRTLETI